MVRKIFPVRLTEEKIEQLKIVAEKYGMSAAEFAREAIDAAIRNPTIIDPTHETKKLLKDLQEGYNAETEWQQTVEVYLNNLATQVKDMKEQLSNKLNIVLSNQGVNDEEIKKRLTKKRLGDLIFDE